MFRHTLIVIALAFVTTFSAAEVNADLTPPAQRKPVPAFTLQNADNKPVSPHSLQGKVVVLNFWATECGGCRQELPSFIELDRAYRAKGLEVIGISMDVMYEGLKDTAEAWAKVRPFVQTQKIAYRILMDDGHSEHAFDIQNMPATWLIDKSGRVAAIYVGIVSKDNLEANINKLLSEK
jgi:cytochrome c biogenesis protein CcmG/thiol:disulfide interchange protein DsbE